MEKIYRDWELKKDDKLKLSDGSILIHRKMDGMYAQWIDESGEMVTGNFDKLIYEDGFYKPFITNTE